MENDIKKPNVNNVVEVNFKLEVELPVFNKVLLCVPLRPGLIAWSLLQLIGTLVIIGYASSYPRDSFPFAMVMINYILEIFICIILAAGMIKENGNMIEMSYHFLVYKIGVSLVFFIISVFWYLSDSNYVSWWFHRSLDPWCSLIFVDNQALGFIVIGLQFYLFLLVRSELMKLQHQISLRSLYQPIHARFHDIFLIDETESRSRFDSTKLILSDENDIKKDYVLNPSWILNNEKPEIKEDPKLHTKIVVDHDDDGTAGDCLPKNVTDAKQMTKTVADQDNDQANKDGFVLVHKK